MRMLMNNLDPEVAEHPDQLIVYGGSGRAARSWSAFDAIVASLQELRGDETLLVQSGKPVGVLRTHEWAPRVLIANSNLVPQWATWEEFRRLESARADHVRPDDRGLVDLHRHPGHPAGHLRDVRGRRGQAVRRLAGRHDHADRRAGRDGRGAAARGHHERRRGRSASTATRPGSPAGSSTATSTRPRTAPTTRCAGPPRPGTRAGPLSIGLLGNAAEIVPAMLAAGAPIDIVTDQTSAHDPLTLPAPRGAVRGHGRAARRGPGRLHRAGPASRWPRTSRPWSASWTAGAEVFDYGNSIRGEAELAGYQRAFAFPGFVPAYIRPLFCEGKGPFRWAALSGDPADIAATDRAILDLFPDNEPLARWIRMAEEKVHFQGLPARICWLGYGERHLAGLRFNELVAAGRGQRADRARPGPPGLRLGRLAVPGDRGDGRRLRRDRRLAAAERPGQHRLRARPG